MAVDHTETKVSSISCTYKTWTKGIISKSKKIYAGFSVLTDLLLLLLPNPSSFLFFHITVTNMAQEITYYLKKPVLNSDIKKA